MRYEVKWEFDGRDGWITDIPDKFAAEHTAYEMRRVFCIIADGREYYVPWGTKVLDTQGNIISEVFNDKAISR